MEITIELDDPNLSSVNHPLPDGTRVKVFLFGNEEITATTEDYEPNGKNGEPTYLITNCSDGYDHWCYADQIAEVL